MQTPQIKQLEEQLSELDSSLHNTTAHVDILLDLAWETGLNNIPRATELTQQGRALSEKLNYEKGLAFSLRNEGYLQSVGKTDLKEGINTLEEALARVRDLNNERKAEADVIDAMGYAFHQLGSYDRALESYLSALEINREIKNTRGEAWGMHNLAAIYRVNKDAARAIEHDLKALTLFRKIDYSVGESLILFTLGQSFRKIGDHDKALQCYLESETLFAELDLAIGLSRTQTAIAELYSEMSDAAQAKTYYQKANKNNDRLENKDAIGSTLISQGDFFLSHSEPQKAINYFNNALIVMEGTDAKPTLRRIHEGLYKCYKKLEDANLALSHLEKLQELKEQIYSEESQTRLEKMQIQMDLEKAEKETEIHRLRYIELAEMQASLIQSEKLALLGNLVAGIAHEVNNPIGVINSITDVSNRAINRIEQEVETILSTETTQPTKKLERTIDILKRNNTATLEAGSRIIDLVGRLKNFVRLDEADLQRIDIHSCLNDTIELLKTQMPEHITIETQYAEIPKLQGYPSQLNQVFMTLLTNAIDAIEDSGSVTISTRVEKEHCIILLADSGKGIPQDKLDTLFDIGFGNNNHTVRMSVGLANVKNVVEKHQGNISVSSVLGEGTTFRIELPL
ncbi:MAG: tetratricopeptide repeat protein [Calditrichia bacterium]